MMWYKKYWLSIGLLALLCIATFFRIMLNGFVDWHVHDLNQSSSSTMARERDTFLAEFIASPEALKVGDVSITIREAWLEENLLRSHFLVWFPVMRHDGYVLCFRVEEKGNGFDHGKISYQCKDIVLYQSHLFNFARISDRDLNSIELLIVNEKEKEKEKEEHKIVLKRK